MHYLFSATVKTVHLRTCLFNALDLNRSWNSLTGNSLEDVYKSFQFRHVPRLNYFNTNLLLNWICRISKLPTWKKISVISLSAYEISFLKKNKKKPDSHIICLETAKLVKLQYKCFSSIKSLIVKSLWHSF